MIVYLDFQIRLEGVSTFGIWLHFCIVFSVVIEFFPWERTEAVFLFLNHFLHIMYFVLDFHTNGSAQLLSFIVVTHPQNLRELWKNRAQKENKLTKSIHRNGINYGTNKICIFMNKFIIRKWIADLSIEFFWKIIIINLRQNEQLF